VSALLVSALLVSALLVSTLLVSVAPLYSPNPILTNTMAYLVNITGF
jgi:hypothetical protein